jgi:hypothetical protein
VDLISALMTTLNLKKVYREGGRVEVREAALVGEPPKSKRYK